MIILRPEEDPSLGVVLSEAEAQRMIDEERAWECKGCSVPGIRILHPREEGAG